MGTKKAALRQQNSNKKYAPYLPQESQKNIITSSSPDLRSSHFIAFSNHFDNDSMA